MESVKCTFRNGERIEKITAIDISRCVKLTNLKTNKEKETTIIELTKEQGDRLLEGLQRGDNILLKTTTEVKHETD